MKIMLISREQSLIKMVQNTDSLKQVDLHVYDDSANPLDVMSAICTQNPSLLLVDDDFLNPHSAHLLRSVRKIHQNMDIIFTTSDTSIELGKEISQLGIQFYAYKPVEADEIIESIKAILHLDSSKNTDIH